MPNSTALSALKKIVGESYARADATTLSNYSWNHGVGALPGPRFVKQWPFAVALPRSTEEISAIVKLCVAEGLHYRAHSSGTGAFYISQSPDTVVIDLCRMNRIVKIDREQQMAVIEPGVTAGRLQAEAMKHGLNCHIVGAGPAHSPLASATSFMGIGVTGISTGTNQRNLLGIEWVAPNGEIVRIGTEGDDWFSEEGPGPGIRGMVRGYMGAHGALGVFTRIGYKLYPWHGKSQLTITGRQPQLGIELEKNMRFFMAAWPSAEAMRDASFRLIRASVLIAMLRMPPSHIGWTLTSSNTEYGLRHQRGDLPEYALAEQRFVWQLITQGHSAEHAAFQEAVLRKIVSETGGQFLDVNPSDAEVLARNIITSCYVGRASRPSIVGGTTFGVVESFNCLPDVYRAAEQMAASESRPGGAIANDSKEGHWSWPTEGRQFWTESIITGEPFEGRGAASGLAMFLQTFHLTSRTARLGTNAFMLGPIADAFGAKLQGVNEWMRRIKNTFDPQWVSDATLYIPRKRSRLLAIFPLLQPLLFSKLGLAVLKGQLRIAYQRFKRSS